MTEHYPRPSILEYIPRDRHAVIEASAGTGKTYTIENMVVELLVRDGVSLDRILVLTFTERAATELRMRIRSKIEEILFNPCRETKCHHEKPGGVWWIDEEAKGRLSQALFSFDAASIGTIHGFFGRVLTEHAFDNGRLFEGMLEDGRTLFGRAFKQVLRRSLARRPGGPAELLALWLEQTSEGVEGLEDLLYKCHASRRWILPSFSISALRREIDTSPLFEIDLKGEAERFQKALQGAKVHGGTIKAIEARLATLSDLIRGSSHEWGVALDKGFQKAVREIADRIRGLALADARVMPIAEAIMRLDGGLVSLEAAMVQTCLPMVREVLERQKAATGQFDYDDLITGVAQALGEDLVEAMRHRYQFALIDEFQDTDELQWSFFKRVFVESGARSIAYLIGDPKQAIYGFRGADVFTYLAARRVVEGSGSPRVRLTSNFRSTPEMIEAYNHILDGSASEPFFDGPIRYDVPIVAGYKLVAEEADGSWAIPIHLLKIVPKGAELKIAELRRGLTRQIAREARRVLSKDAGLRVGPQGKTELIKPGGVFILTATNKDGLAISEALREADVPFAFYKQDGLFQTSEAREVHDLLEAVDDPTDPRKRGRAWITPFFAVPLGDLSDLADLPDSHPLVERLCDWNDLASQRRFEKLFTRILDDSGIIRRELFLKDDERALTNYLHLFEILLEDARATGCELTDLVTTLSAYIRETRKPPGEDGNVQRLETDRTAVQIMTIHKSKGLEADVVFIYGGFTAFPSSGLHEYHEEHQQRVLFIGDDDKAKEQANRERKLEEQRLYYVAMTRAKARMYLPLVPGEFWSNRWDGGYSRVNKRLLEVVIGLKGSGKDRRFKIVSFQDQPLLSGSDDPDRAGCDVVSWLRKSDLLKEGDYSDSGEFGEYRKQHAGYEVTSYSRMKSALNTKGELVPLGREELDREAAQPILAAPPSERELPGGTAAGLMLHEILEVIPFDSPGMAQTPDAWGALKPVDEVIIASMVHNNIDAAKYRSEAEAMVYHALTCEIRTCPGRSIPGLYRCPKTLREMEFLFPYPEKRHPPLSEPRPEKLVIERGFIKGYVDLVVEYDGLVYFADWKSDVLPSYGQETIEEHVATHYDLQAKLYVLALMKALGVHSESEYENRFGGLVYVFLRGLRTSDDVSPGIYFRRPSWFQVLAYEREIKQSPDRSWRPRS